MRLSRSALPVVALFLAVLGFAKSAAAGPLDSFLSSGGNVTIGAIHTHSAKPLGSDGKSSIMELALMTKERGYQFLVLTDHSEMIQDIQAYIDACEEATRETGILVVPGIEVGINVGRGRVHDPSGNMIHVLGIGKVSKALVDRLNDYLGYTEGNSTEPLTLKEAQAGVALRLHNAGMGVVIAHPGLRNPQEKYDYVGFPDENVDGGEAFNDSPLSLDLGDQKVLGILGLLGGNGNQGASRAMAVTAGCDYHGKPGAYNREYFAGEDTPFNRITVFVLDSPLPSDWGAGCRTIANAVRHPGTMVAIALPSIPNPFTMNDHPKNFMDLLLAILKLASPANLLGAGIYQDGRCIARGLAAGVGAITVNRSEPFYVHVPGFLIARIAPSGQQDEPRVESPDNPPSSSDDQPRQRRTSPGDTLWYFLIDRSTSMVAPDKEQIRQVAKRLVANGLPSTNCLAVSFSGTGNMEATETTSDPTQVGSYLVNGQIHTDNGTAILDVIMCSLLASDKIAPGKKVVIFVITDGEEWTDGIIKNPDIVARELEKRGAKCVILLTANGSRTNGPIRQLIGSKPVGRVMWDKVDDSSWKPADLSSYVSAD